MSMQYILQVFQMNEVLLTYTYFEQGLEKMYTTVNPIFYYVKGGLRGCILHGRVNMIMNNRISTGNI